MELLRISGYVLGLVGTYAETERLLPDTWLWLTLPKGGWHPSVVIFDPATLWLPFLVLLLQVLLITFLIRFLHSLGAGTLREMRPWLLVRAVLLGLSFLLFLLSSTEAVNAGQQIIDTRVKDVLANLRSGLSQTDVEMLIVQANLAMLRPPDRAAVEGADSIGNQLYGNVQDARARIGRGEHIFDAPPSHIMDPRGRLFHCSQVGKTQANTDHDRRLLCSRKYMSGSDPHGWYFLLIKFDASTLLQSARYVRLHHQEPRCRLISEIPSAPSKTYPEVCSREEELKNLGI
jgi:hypothetical protein